MSDNARKIAQLNRQIAYCRDEAELYQMLHDLHEAASRDEEFDESIRKMHADSAIAWQGAADETNILCSDMVKARNDLLNGQTVGSLYADADARGAVACL